MPLERKETRLFLEPVNVLDGVIPFDFPRKHDDKVHASEFLIDSQIALEFPPNMSQIYDSYQEEPVAQKRSTGINAIIGGGAGALVGGVIGNVIKGEGLDLGIGTVTGVIGGGIAGALLAVDASKTNVVQSYPLPFRYSMIFAKPYYNSAYEYIIWVYNRLLEHDLLTEIDKNSSKVTSELFSADNHKDIAKNLMAKLKGKTYVIKGDINDQILNKIERTVKAIESGTLVYKNVSINEEEMEKWNLRSYIKCECDEQIFVNEDGINSTDKIIEMTPVSVTTFTGKPSDYGLKVEIREHGISVGEWVALGVAGAVIGALGGAIAGGAGGAIGALASVSSSKSFSIGKAKSSLFSGFKSGAGLGAIAGGAIGGATGALIGLAKSAGWSDSSDEIVQLIKIDFWDFIPSQNAEVSLTNIGDLFGLGTEILVNNNFSFDIDGKWCQYNDVINSNLTQGKYGEHFNKKLKGKEKNYPHIVFKNEEYKLRRVHSGGTISNPVFQKSNWEVAEPSTTFECNFNYVPVDPGTEFINNPPERTRYQKWIGKYNDIIEGYVGTERMHFKRRQNLTRDYEIQGISIDGQSVLKGMEFDETFASVPERLQKGMPLQIDARLENTPFSIMSCFIDCYIDGEKVASLSPFPPESFLEPVKDFFNYFGLGSIPDAASVAVDIARGALNIPAGAKEYTEYWHGFIPAEKLSEAKRVKIKFVARYGSVYVESDTYDCRIEDSVVMGEIYDRIWEEYNEWQLDNRNRYPLPINPEYGVGDTFKDRFEDALKFVDKGVKLLDIVPPGRPVNLRCNIGDNNIDLFWDAPVAPDPQFIKPEELTLDNLGDQLEEAAKKVAEEAAGLFETPQEQSTIGILGALDLKEFRIYRKGQYDINWQHIASVTETRYKASGMEPGIKYEYYVESVDTQNNSSLILDGLFLGLTRGVKGSHFYPMNSEYNTYTVQGSESYADIAEKFDIEEDELKKVNLTPGGSPTSLSDGKVISLIRRHLFLKVEGISIDDVQDTNIIIVQE